MAQRLQCDMFEMPIFISLRFWKLNQCSGIIETLMMATRAIDPARRQQHDF